MMLHHIDMLFLCRCALQLSHALKTGSQPESAKLVMEICAKGQHVIEEAAARMPPQWVALPQIAVEMSYLAVQMELNTARFCRLAHMYCTTLLDFGPSFCKLAQIGYGSQHRSVFEEGIKMLQDCSCDSLELFRKISVKSRYGLAACFFIEVMSARGACGLYLSDRNDINSHHITCRAAKHFAGCCRSCTLSWRKSNTVRHS